MSGARSYHAGRSAEASVARHYEGRGAKQLAERWRGAAGEIDLIFQDGDETVFVEVKASKSAARAARLLGPRQIERLAAAAEEYCADLAQGSLTPMRFDVALVDGQGVVSVHRAALGP